MKYHVYFSTLLFFTLTLVVQGQTTLWFHELGEEEGLSVNTIIDVYVDSEGLTWIGAVEGLFRFDGHKIKQYTSNLSDSMALSENQITSKFFEDGRKNIWFCTNTTIHCYQRESDSFSRYKLLNHNKLPLLDGYSAICLERDSFLWLQAGKKEIFRYNIHNGTNSKPLGQLVFDVRVVPGISPDGKLRYLFSMDGTKSAGLEIFEQDGSGNLLKRPIYFDGSDSKKDSLFISNVIFEQDTAIWMATWSGIYKWNLIDDHLTQYQVGNSHLDCIVPFHTNHFLVCESGNGLWLFDKTHESFSKIESRSLKNPKANLNQFLYEPKIGSFGNIWAENEGGGVIFTNPDKNKFESIPKMPLVDGSTMYDFRTFVQDNKKNIWSSTFGDGIFLLNEQGIVLRHFHPKHPKNNSLFDNQANHILLDKSQNIWVGTPSGVAIYTPSSDKFLPVFDDSGKHVPYVVYFLQLENGEILASTLQQGIYNAVFSEGSWKLTQILSPQDDSDYYIDIYEDAEGTIYIGHKSAEVFVYNYSKGKLEFLKSLPIPGFLNGFHEDKTKLWIATSNGLVELDKTNLNKEPVFYTEKDGIASKNLQSMVTDLEGNLWFGTTNGIAKFQFSDTSFYNFTLADGIRSTIFYSYAALEHSNGSLWFGGNNGITIVRPEKINPVENVPIIQITDIKINDEASENLTDELTGATNVSRIKKLKRSFSENTLSFEFVAIDYSDPMATKMEYFMEGEDNNWVSLEKGESGFARYSNLSPGNYTFKVRAYNSDGVSSGEKSMIDIKIDPPWWQTWWARTLAVLALLSLIYAYYRFRIAQIRKEAAFQKKEAEYKQLVAETETAVLRLQMNPHFIFNSMNSINSYILQKDVDTASNYLHRFARLMRMILKFAAQPLIAISDEIELLDLYLQTETMRFEKKFEYSFDLKDDLDPDEFVIPTMILQPFVENAIWHGLSNKKDGEGIIKISFWQEGESFYCSVEDNGVGRAIARKISQKAKTHESKALSITEHRLQLLEKKNGVAASLEIQDLKGADQNPIGTKVVLRFPLL